MKSFKEHLENLKSDTITEVFLEKFGKPLGFDPESGIPIAVRLIYEMLKFELDGKLEDIMLDIEKKLKRGKSDDRELFTNDTL